MKNLIVWYQERGNYVTQNLILKGKDNPQGKTITQRFLLLKLGHEKKSLIGLSFSCSNCTIEIISSNIQQKAYQIWQFYDFVNDMCS